MPFDLAHLQTAPLDSKNLLYIGRIAPEKRIEDMLDILKAVLDAGCETELHLVGECELDYYAKDLKSKAKALGIEKHVKMHGFQSNVSDYYRNGGICLMTSAAEGYCLTLIESMAFGVPVVTYDLPNLDIVQKGKGLVVVPQRDVWGAAMAIVTLLQDERKHRELGSAARESVKEIYEMDLAQLWSRVFENVGSSKMQVAEPDYMQIKNAVNIAIDFYLKGVICRGNTAQTTVGNYTVEPITAVKKMCANGDLGFRDILKFIKKWFEYKLRRKKKGAQA